MRARYPLGFPSVWQRTASPFRVSSIDFLLTSKILTKSQQTNTLRSKWRFERSEIRLGANLF